MARAGDKEDPVPTSRRPFYTSNATILSSSEKRQFKSCKPAIASRLISIRVPGRFICRATWCRIMAVSPCRAPELSSSTLSSPRAPWILQCRPHVQAVAVEKFQGMFFNQHLLFSPTINVIRFHALCFATYYMFVNRLNFYAEGSIPILTIWFPLCPFYYQSLHNKITFIIWRFPKRFKQHQTFSLKTFSGSIINSNNYLLRIFISSIIPPEDRVFQRFSGLRPTTHHSLFKPHSSNIINATQIKMYQYENKYQQQYQWFQKKTLKGAFYLWWCHQQLCSFLPSIVNTDNEASLFWSRQQIIRTALGKSIFFINPITGISSVVCCCAAIELNPKILLLPIWHFIQADSAFTWTISAPSKYLLFNQLLSAAVYTLVALKLILKIDGFENTQYKIHCQDRLLLYKNTGCNPHL